nr:hypothetical protein BaRGS_011015 [Batillaria attramentaria]
MDLYPTMDDFWRTLQYHRDDLVYVHRENHTLHTEMKFYVDLINAFIIWMYRAIQFARDGDDWRELVAYQLLLSSKNDIGVERTLGSIYYLLGRFNSHSDYLWYLSKQSMGVGNLRASKLFSPTVEQSMNKRLSSYSYWNVSYIEIMREEIKRGSSSQVNASFLKSKWWFDNMTLYLDTMFDVQQELATEILDNVSNALYRDTQDIVLSIALFAAILVICPIILFSVKAMVSDIQRYAITLSDQTKELSRERKRAELLLYQMLPEAVATQLKQNRHVSAESYEEAEKKKKEGG